MSRISTALQTLVGVVLAALLLSGCHTVAPRLFVKRPADDSLDRAISKLWAEEIRRVARDGDWLLGRSYGKPGVAIVALTTGEEFSHAAVVDISHDTVVEAVHPQVQEISLERFVHRYRYIAVVRNPRLSDDERRATIDLARAEVGAEFDLGGMVGFDNPDRWYCTELVWWANGMDAEFGRPTIIEPNEMLDYGELIYFSGRRDDPQIQAIAAARRAAEHGADEPAY